ncbi:hypothetical protein [Algoriphagus yeomjeoni]|uniref:DUF2178 domain-containing protein n=1 Tax=Algoriphagus yeomjeoni TaxID=291403 RepID=A0A327PH70_9BACT|nr:hypothetical protein [Algoriphagus yeomjeoni]RAI91558.1 hypothetical protein LV83_01747 [Algoriphagus yeomjeoni]
MNNKSILHVPLLSPGWKKVAFLFFSLPILLVIGMAITRMDISPDESAQVIYGCWAIGFGLLNLSREKDEDEMIKSLRLQAYQTGSYWLIWGVGALMLINYLRFDRITSEIFTAYLVLFLLNAYVYAAFQYQKFMATKD